MKGHRSIVQLLFPAMLFFSCNAAKEKQEVKDTANASIATPVIADSVAIKTGWAIEKFARQDLQAGGYKVLSLQVDSLSYTMVSLKDYYINRMAELKKEKEEYRTVNIKLKQSGVAVNQSKLADDSIKTANAMKVLENLAEKADAEKNIIRVAYKLVAQTNTTIYNTAYTKYLFEKDFTEVKIKFQDVQH